MKFLLIGNYGAGNYGDEAILLALLQSLSKEFPFALFSVMCADPKKTIAFQPHFYASSQITFVPFLPFGIRSFGKAIFQNTVKHTLKAYRECDAVILGGGGLFTDDESMKAPLLWAYHTRIATYFKKPIFAFGVGIGPLSRNLSKWALKKSLSKVSYLGVRDVSSAETMKNISAVNTVISPDPVFLLDNDSLHKEEIEMKIPDNPYIIVSVRPWKVSNIVYKKFAQLYDFIIKDFGLKILFIPFQTYPQNDEVFMGNIIEQMKYREQVISASYPLSFSNILHIYEKAEAVISMRFHALLFSILTDTACLPIIYSEKTRAFLSDSLRNYPYSIDIGSLEMIPDEDLIDKIGLFLKNRQSIQRSFKEVNGTLKSSAIRSFQSFSNHIKNPLDRRHTF